jgi:hypothetical protein
MAMALAAQVVAGQTPASPPLPVYEVWRAGTPIRVDGKLDDAGWAAAPRIDRFLDTVTGSPGTPVTSAQVLYDDRFLYFGFRCEDSNVWATMTRRDEHLWSEEVVEIFLQADPAQKSYIELEVNPLGTLIDIFLVDVRKAQPYESWNSQKIQWAAAVDGTVDGQPGDRGWSAEIALPLEDVVPTPHPLRPGARWRLNLYRIEKRPQAAYLAWSPTLRPDFHTPARFGEIVFMDRSVP